MEPFTLWLLVIGVVVVIATGLLVAWGVRVLDRRGRQESEAQRIQRALGLAIQRERALAEASVLPVATLPARGRPSVELTGSVPTVQARQRVLQVVAAELDRVRPGMAIVDRLDVVPPGRAQRPA